VYVTGNIEDGALFLFSYYYELHINILGNSAHSMNIFRMQKIIIRIIMGLISGDSWTDLFKKLRILPRQTKYALPLLLFMVSNRAGQRIVGARGRPLIWLPLKPIFSKLLV
jgi:hypothetical protein